MAQKADPSRSSNNRVVATNRKARHNYSILETFDRLMPCSERGMIVGPGRGWMSFKKLPFSSLTGR